MSNISQPEHAVLELLSYESQLLFGDVLGSLCVENLDQMRRERFQVVSPHSLRDHFRWQCDRLNNIFERACAGLGPEGKASVELSLKDYELMRLLTSVGLSTTQRAPSPVELRPKPLPPVAEPSQHDSGLFPEADIGHREEYNSYEILDEEPAVGFVSQPGPSQTGAVSDAAVVGVADAMSRRMTIAAARSKAKDCVKAKKQDQRHVLLGDGPLTDMDKAVLPSGHGKRKRIRVRTLDVDLVRVVPPAFHRSQYVDSLGGLKFHRPELRKMAHAEDGSLHLANSCEVCDFVADRLSIKQHNRGYKFLITNKEQRLILGMHIYCNNYMTMPFDDFVDRSGILNSRSTPSPSVIQQWATVGRYVERDGAVSGTEAGEDLDPRDLGQ